MLLLLFCLQDERYAIPSRQVLEIIPLVDLQPIHQSPKDIPGFFNYRGCIVPVIDLCQRLKGQSARPHLSTRIILVDLRAGDRRLDQGPSSDLASAPHNGEEERLGLGLGRPGSILGLMAERVTDTIHSQDAGMLSHGLQVGDNPMLGNMLQDSQGLIQVLNLSHLLDDPQTAQLMPAALAVPSRPDAALVQARMSPPATSPDAAVLTPMG
jgi:chemotaxis-related protein WspB